MRILALGLPLALVLSSLGCDSKEIHIGGNVTFNGTPIEEGTIEFIPIEGTAGPSTGAAIKKGRYDCSKDTGLVRGGRYQVRISALAKTGKTTPNIFQPGGPPLELSENYIPAAYNSNSTLTAVLAKDSTDNTFDFKLEGK
jgi:hypothetical protein